MPFEELLGELNERRAKALRMGKPEILERMKDAGLLNARERLDHLLDEGSFVESGLLATAARPEVRDKAPADGKIGGFGKVDGRWIGVVSNDFSVMGASSALNNLKKMKHVKDVGNKRGFPLVFIGESSGSRMPDRRRASSRRGRRALGSRRRERWISWGSASSRAGCTRCLASRCTRSAISTSPSRSPIRDCMRGSTRLCERAPSTPCRPCSASAYATAHRVWRAGGSSPRWCCAWAGASLAAD